MCGIYGFTEINERTRALSPLLAFAMEDRGRSSWGATNGQEIYKALGPITASYKLPDGWDPALPMVYHTRAATHGSVTIPNQHPFAFEGDAGTVLGVHNGVIGNHAELNRRHKRNFDVDSMHIFAHIAEGKSLEDLQGSGVCVFWWNGELHFLRFNSANLVVVRLRTGELAWCSTNIIARAARMIGVEIDAELVTAEDVCYKMVRDGDGKLGLVVVGPMKVGYDWTQNRVHGAAACDPWEGRDFSGMNGVVARGGRRGRTSAPYEGILATRYKDGDCLKCGFVLPPPDLNGVMCSSCHASTMRIIGDASYWQVVYV